MSSVSIRYVTAVLFLGGVKEFLTLTCVFLKRFGRNLAIIYIKPLIICQFFYGWLTVHRIPTLVNFQIFAQNSYLFIYNTFIKILYMFRSLPCSSSGGLRRNCIYEASGNVTVCR